MRFDCHASTADNALTSFCLLPNLFTWDDVQNTLLLLNIPRQDKQEQPKMRWQNSMSVFQCVLDPPNGLFSAKKPFVISKTSVHTNIARQWFMRHSELHNYWWQFSLLPNLHFPHQESFARLLSLQMPSKTQISTTYGLLNLMDAHHTNNLLNLHLGCTTSIVWWMLYMDVNSANSMNMRTSGWNATTHCCWRCLRRRFIQRWWTIYGSGKRSGLL